MGFGFQTTTADVLDGIDLSEKRAIVTGGTSGLGYETCRALAAAGAEVLLTARDEIRGGSAVAKIIAAVPGANVAYALLELDSLASVRRFAADVLQRYDRVDLLINNAGIMATPFSRTKDGFEQQFGTNHLGHFLLTSLLAPALLNAAPARVISLSSAGHHFSDIHWGDPNFERHDYNKWQAYGQSKTANALFAFELDRRLSDRGVNAFAVHPGAITTGLSAHFTPEDRAWINQTVAKMGETRMKSIPAGAASSVWAATAAELAGHGGVYIEDCHVATESKPGSLHGYAPWALNAVSALRLWDVCETLTGQTFVGSSSR